MAMIAWLYEKKSANTLQSSDEKEMADLLQWWFIYSALLCDICTHVVRLHDETISGVVKYIMKARSLDRRITCHS